MMDIVTARRLSKRERAFVELVVDPTDSRAIIEKARSLGYTDPYGSQLAHKAHVAAAIEKRTNEHVALLRARAGRVLSALADSAEKGDASAAGPFFEVVGPFTDHGVADTGTPPVETFVGMGTSGRPRHGE